MVSSLLEFRFPLDLDSMGFPEIGIGTNRQCRISFAMFITYVSIMVLSEICAGAIRDSAAIP
jgi:hypothetical protein